MDAAADGDFSRWIEEGQSGGEFVSGPQVESKLRGVESLLSSEQVRVQLRPKWVDDSEASICSHCEVRFRLDLRRHHCRMCGNVFCYKCTPDEHRLPLPVLAYMSPVRVCMTCAKQAAASQSLCQCVIKRDLTSASKLIEAGVDVNSSVDTEPPLVLAARNDDEDMLQLLLQHGADPLPPVYSDAPLHVAIQVKANKVLSRLLLPPMDQDQEFSPRSNIFDCISVKYGDSPLMRAVRFDNVDALKMLSASGADWWLPSRGGITPATSAAVGGSLEVHQLMEEINVKIPTKWGCKAVLRLLLAYPDRSKFHERLSMRLSQLFLTDSLAARAYFPQWIALALRDADRAGAMSSHGVAAQPIIFPKLLEACLQDTTFADVMELYFGIVACMRAGRKQALGLTDAIEQHPTTGPVVRQTARLARLLCDIGAKLVVVAPAHRTEELRKALTAMEPKLPQNLVFAMPWPRRGCGRVLSVCPAFAKAFSTNTRAPYFLAVEVLLLPPAAYENNSVEPEDTVPALNTSDSIDERSELHLELGNGQTTRESPNSGSDSPLLQRLGSSTGKVKPESGLQMDCSEDMRARGEISRMAFGTPWSEIKSQVCQTSPHCQTPGWDLLPVIVKANDDLRQERLASQLIAWFGHVYRQAGLPMSVLEYNVMATESAAGMLQALPDAASLDHIYAIMKAKGMPLSLQVFMEHAFPSPELLAAARLRMARSLAAYSLICYVLAVKDRHDGNVLLDAWGRLVHIDFGFMLGDSPGGVQFERAPFKLTQEVTDALGGREGPDFQHFIECMQDGFVAIRRRANELLLLLESSGVTYGEVAGLPCFSGGVPNVLQGVRQRLLPGAEDASCRTAVLTLIEDASSSSSTYSYEVYQKVTRSLTNWLGW